MNNPVVRIKLILLAVVYIYATGFVFDANATSFPTFPDGSGDCYFIETITANLTGKVPGNEGLNLASAQISQTIRKESFAGISQNPEPFSQILSHISIRHFIEYSYLEIEFPDYKIIFPFHYFW